MQNPFPIITIHVVEILGYFDYYNFGTKEDGQAVVQQIFKTRRFFFKVAGLLALLKIGNKSKNFFFFKIFFTSQFKTFVAKFVSEDLII